LELEKLVEKEKELDAQKRDKKDLLKKVPLCLTHSTMATRYTVESC